MAKGVVYRFRSLIVIIPVIVGAFLTFGEYENHYLVYGIGLPVFLLGFSLRLWAQFHLRYRICERTSLTVTGPYAFFRNPIYIANTIILTSLMLMCELVWLVPIVFLWCIILYDRVAANEEAHLVAKFGAPYEEYIGKVRRWIPRFKPLPKPAGYEKPQQRASRLLLESYNILFLLIPISKNIITHYYLHK